MTKDNDLYAARKGRSSKTKELDTPIPHDPTYDWIMEMVAARTQRLINGVDRSTLSYDEETSHDCEVLEAMTMCEAIAQGQITARRKAKKYLMARQAEDQHPAAPPKGAWW